MLQMRLQPCPAVKAASVTLEGATGCCSQAARRICKVHNPHPEPRPDGTCRGRQSSRVLMEAAPNRESRIEFDKTPGGHPRSHEFDALLPALSPLHDPSDCA